MFGSMGTRVSFTLCVLATCFVAGASTALADPCRSGYHLRSGVCVAERDIELSCGSSVADGREYQLVLQPHPGRTVYCFANAGGDQSNILFGRVVRTGGCLYQHPAVNDRGQSAVSLDFCERGPRDTYLQSLSDILCDDLGVASTTCHRFYRP